jgi:hypothetical protein
MKLIKQLKIDSFELDLNDWDEEKIWDPVKQSAKSRKASLDKLT